MRGQALRCRASAVAPPAVGQAMGTAGRLRPADPQPRVASPQPRLPATEEPAPRIPAPVPSVAGPGVRRAFADAAVRGVGNAAQGVRAAAAPPRPATGPSLRPLSQQPREQRHEEQRPRAWQPTQPQPQQPALPDQAHGAEQELPSGLALTWLGTNSGSPTLERNVSCTLVRLPGAVQMVDCGEGSHRQLRNVPALQLQELDGIFITHMHGDHCFGLGAALTLLDEAKAAAQTDPARRRHHVYGPPGLAAVVMGDTVCSTAIGPLAAGCDVIAHEATFARGMEAKARIAQHSTGWMAGAFAAAVGAQRLVLTHFSARYREGPKELESQMRTSRATGYMEMEQQSWAVAALIKEAADEYGRWDRVFAASDFFTFHVPYRLPPAPVAAEAVSMVGAGAAR
ncbi:Ribonuclease Z [Tetrabaena socialis]|uniref:Ribonuclease Z n=1 Tax=Tetrabaena socialis TaxID=47790 RepID=A0A2J7ZXG2_9CHLO|nr:Ribonuclease Z [Tetrabaena socialis]|eukprot:PNH04946.1 Ribonuclease Z [Tetrabaena socialis]